MPLPAKSRKYGNIVMRNSRKCLQMHLFVLVLPLGVCLLLAGTDGAHVSSARDVCPVLQLVSDVSPGVRLGAPVVPVGRSVGRWTDLWRGCGRPVLVVRGRVGRAACVKRWRVWCDVPRRLTDAPVRWINGTARSTNG